MSDRDNQAEDDVRAPLCAEPGREERQQARRTRGCLDWLAPLLVLACLALSNYCFLLLEVLKRDQLAWYNLVYIVIYHLVEVMVLWCLCALLGSDPGYVPRGYQYDIDALSPLDQALYRWVEANKDNYEFPDDDSKDREGDDDAEGRLETKSTIRESAIEGLPGWEQGGDGPRAWSPSGGISGGQSFRRLKRPVHKGTLMTVRLPTQLQVGSSDSREA